MSEEPLHLRPAHELLDLDVELLLARHEADDLVMLLLPRLLRAYAERGGGPVLHLPPTAWVLGGLEPIEQALSARSVLLVPRATADLPDDGLQPTQLQLERAGRISETVMAIDGVSGAAGFVPWWIERVEWVLGSLDGRERPVRPEDRVWLARYLGARSGTLLDGGPR